MGWGGMQGDAGHHITSGVQQMEHSLSCLDTLEAFWFCDHSDGVSVTGLLAGFTEKQINQLALGRDAFSTSLFSAAHTLPQGRGWKPSWQTWLITRASVPKERCVYVSGTRGTVPEALLNQPGAVWLPPWMLRPQSQGHKCPLDGSGSRFTTL